MFFPSTVRDHSDLLLALYCLSEQCILGKLSIHHFDILSFVSKTDVTVPLTSNKWNSSQSFLRICFLCYNPEFGSTKILFFFFAPYILVTLRVARGILVSPPGVEPTPPAMKAQSLNHWTVGKSFPFFLLNLIVH